jgi:hypothetical protein
VPTLLHFQYIAHRGACGKTLIMPQNGWPGAEPTDTGSRSACVVVGVWVARGRRAAGRTRGAVAGTRRGGAGASDLRSELIT